MLASGNRLAGRQHTSPSLWQTPDKQSSVPLVSTAAWSRFQNELPEAKTQSDLLRWYGIPCNIYKDERNLKSDYNYNFKNFKIYSICSQKFIYKMDKRDESKPDARFKPATSRLLDYCSFDWATWKVIKFCTNEIYQ